MKNTKIDKRKKNTLNFEIEIANEEKSQEIERFMKEQQ